MAYSWVSRGTRPTLWSFRRTRSLCVKFTPTRQGGAKEHAQQLQAARELWTNAKQNPGRDGKAKREDKAPRSKANSYNLSLETADPEQVHTSFRIRLLCCWPTMVGQIWLSGNVSWPTFKRIWPSTTLRTVVQPWRQREKVSYTST